MNSTKLKTFIITLAVIVFTFNSLAITYYVSTDGLASATGTKAAPLTLAAALAKTLAAGDSIIIRGGIYNFSASVTFSKTGSSTNLLHFVNYPGETPIFDFRSIAYGTAGLKVSGNYLHVKGITVQGAGDNGFYVSGNNNKIENCIARWNCDSGFQLKTGTGNLVLNCDSYDNFDYKTGGTSSPDYGGNADGFADKQYTNTNGTNRYKGCRSWRNSDDGWDCYQKVGNTAIDSCWCYANSPANYDMTDNIRFKTDSASWFYQFKNTAGRYVITNYGNKNGFKLGGDYTANNATLKNCVAVSNSGKGFDQNNNAGAMILYNCTAYLNGTNYGFSNASYGTLLIKNSASLSGTNSNSFKTTSYTQSNNTWSSGFTCAASDFTSLEVAQMLNARQTDGSLPEITLLHLTATSALKDKGVNLGFPYNGTAPDLGAFEYNNATPVDYVTSTNNQLKIFPNPVNENSAISFNSPTNDIITIQLIDLTGRILQKINYRITIGENVIGLNTLDLNKGNYFCTVKGKNLNLTCKFTK